METSTTSIRTATATEHADRIRELSAEGLGVRLIAHRLAEEGITISKSGIHRFLQSIAPKTDTPGDAAAEGQPSSWRTRR